MSMHKIKTAMVLEVVVDFEFFPAERGSHNCAPIEDDLWITNVSAVLPQRGSAEWEDLREECYDHIEGLRQKAEAEKDDAGDYLYQRARDEAAERR